MKASFLVLFAICALFASQANSKSVFAHYMMGNSYPSDVPNFANAIRLAQQAGIDGFALNIGPDEWMPDRISKMYQAATQFPGFKLFISFDMAVMSDVNVLINYVKQYVSHPNSFFYNNRYFVSTFAGESQSFGEDSVNNGWQRRFKDPLREAGIDVFFCPAWTALGPSGMYDNHPVLDGAFSWAAWSNGNEYKTLDEDNAYMEGARRNGKIYMAGVSPWFFTHFDYKNWIYKSESLYTTRWEEIVQLQPDLVEIITWNDYGESHYIGPIDGAFPAGSEAWTIGYDHTAWLDMASYYISAYKAGSFPSVNVDKVYFWYRPHSKNAQRNDARPNNADWAEDIVVVHALLTGPAQIQVSIGGQVTSFEGQAGRNTFQVAFGEGDVVVSILRNGQTLASKQGDHPIQNGGDKYNFNAVVGMLQNIPTVSQLLMR